MNWIQFFYKILFMPISEMDVIIMQCLNYLLYRSSWLAWFVSGQDLSVLVLVLLDQLWPGFSLRLQS